jgi:hypothetical protein
MVEKILYSFPVQLFINNIKKNQVLLFCWLLLFIVVTGNFGKLLGIPYLFLDPEYIDRVDFWSFFIIGITVGGFTMAFHITCYIIDSFRFSFLGTLSRPFSRFAFNNSIIPVIFLIVYLISIVRFQLDNEYFTAWQIISQILGLLIGCLSMIVFLITYFRFTNQDIFKLITANVDKQLRRSPISRANVLQRLEIARKKTIRVDNYLDIGFRIRQVNPDHGYDKEAILKVFDQNHLNLVLIEFVIFFVILILGIFKDYAIFQIPAAASVVLILTIFIMFTGAVSYWFRGWSISVVVLFLVLLNILVKNDLITSEYRAYGLDYGTERAEYSLEELRDKSRSTNRQQDRLTTLEILQNWRAKFDGPKPKLVILSASGGGQRAALWSMKTLQAADSATNGQLFNSAALITGSSGGVIGASYYRELVLKKVRGENIDLNHPKYLANISKDNLNPIIFSLLVSDLFIRYQSFEYGGFRYKKDRGYAFEQKLNKNTEFILDKPLAAYLVPEKQAIIPMLFVAPTVINDGRKLFISPHSVSYMTTSTVYGKDTLNPEIKGIDFQRFFKNQKANNLRFLSALRLGASFPYITPNVMLPSDPPMEIMDAGISDNFGISDALHFLYVFKDWIAANTSGVVIVAIRDSEDDDPIEKNVGRSLFQRIFTPISSVYNNLGNIQDINNDNLLEQAQSWFDNDISCVEFEYVSRTIFEHTPEEEEAPTDKQIQQEAIERASLNWRLTNREKQNILKNFYSAKNRAALVELQQLLNESNAN